MSLEQAQRDGLVDLIDARPGSVLVVTDDEEPVTLSVDATAATFTYTPLANDTQGTTLTYGPLTGALQLAPGAPGAPPVVTLDGQAVAPHPPAPGPAPGPSPSPSPPPGSSPQPGPSPQPAAKLRLVGKPRLKGRKLVVKVAVPAAGVLKATARRKTRVLGRAKARPRAAGTRTLTVRLKRRPPRKVALTVTFKPVGAPLQTVRRGVRRR